MVQGFGLRAFTAKARFNPVRELRFRKLHSTAEKKGLFLFIMFFTKLYNMQILKELVLSLKNYANKGKNNNS